MLIFPLEAVEFFFHEMESFGRVGGKKLKTENKNHSIRHPTAII